MNGHLRINDRLRELGSQTARWQVIDPMPRNGCVRLFDSAKLEDKYKPFQELNAKIISGELILERRNAPRVGVTEQDDPKLQQRLAVAMGHVREVERIRRTYKISLAAAYDTAKAAYEEARKAAQQRRAAQEFAPEDDGAELATFPSRPTMYRYVKAARNGLPLLRGDANKGNRTSRYEEDVVTFICKQATSLYLQSQSPFTLGKLTERINDELNASERKKEKASDGAELDKKPHDGDELDTEPRDGAKPTNKFRITTEFVKKLIYERLSVDSEEDRMDPEDVPAGKSIASRRIVVSTPFERVEQDAVHLPFVVRTEHGPASNVYLVHSLDCFSSFPLGWHMTVGAPSESDGMKCVESTLFSKAAAFKRLGYECEFDVYGTPHQLIFDNGPETKGERMRRLTLLGIDPMHCKSRHAHGKPFIERLNRSLKSALETLPGCTRFNGKDGGRDPIKEGDQLMTLEQLERWVVRWYCESWVKHPLKRHKRSDLDAADKLGSTPAARMQSIKDRCFAMPLSPSLTDWRMTLYQHEFRTLSRKTGITYETFHYRGDNLTYLIGRHGEVEIKVFVDPDDYRQVFVDDGPGMPLVALIADGADLTTPAHSIAYKKEQSKLADANDPEDPSVAAFRRDVQRDSVQPSRKPGTKKPRKAEQNRAVATAVKADKALQRAIDRPLGMAPDLTTTAAPSMAAFSFDDAEALPVLNRTNGKKQ